MPKIFFEGREYDDPEQMTPEARARYEKAVKMLPDRDKNGIPDLLEGDEGTVVSPSPVTKPAVDAVKPETTLGPGVPVNIPQSRKEVQTAARNRRWILILIIGIISVCVACFGIIMVGIFSLLRSSEAYQMAVETAKSHPTVQQVLGTPIEDGIFSTGSVEENDFSGSAELEIPLSGPNQSGTLYVSAVKEENTWRLIYLLLEAGGKDYHIFP